MSGCEHEWAQGLHRVEARSTAALPIGSSVLSSNVAPFTEVFPGSRCSGWAENGDSADPH